MGILSNNEGKILKSNQTGKVLKQNFNFERAYKSYNSSNAAIRFNKNITANSKFSLGFFAKRIGENPYSVPFLLSNQSGFRWNISYKDRFNLYVKDVLNQYYYQVFNCLIYNGIDLVLFNRNDTLISLNESTFDFDFNYFELIKTSYVEDYVKISDFIIFNRDLTVEECLHRSNNNLGNEFKYYTGVEIHCPLNKAEILDFSLSQDSSDLRIGVRDVSGFNRHGEIINLPVGTIQEQLNYANENLFESW